MEIINGGLSVDLRGRVSFVNDFSFEKIKRFYVVENRFMSEVRAWHGHKVEEKYVYVVAGEACIMLKDMETGEKEEVVLSEDMPQILHNPAGKYNGSYSLKENTKIIYFSTATLEESKEDDYRKDWP